jgi:hypothetical protein
MKNVFCTKCGNVVLGRLDKRLGRHSNNHDCRTAPEWCNAPFGGPHMVQRPGETKLVKVENRWQCRLPKDHDGGHDCRAAQEVGYVPEIEDTCVICQKPVLPHHAQSGPHLSQKPGYQFAHSTCISQSSPLTPPKPKARSAAAEAIFGRR